MKSLDFYVDFNIEVPNINEAFTVEAERELRALADEHSDLVGAAVSLETLVEAETSYLYQVRIVVYKRPENMAVVQKKAEPMDALRDALSALQEKVRTSREKLAQFDTHREDEKHMVTDDLSADEVYATYVKDQDPAQIFEQGRMEIATRLMVEEGLSQKAAYFAADQILQAAQQRMTTKK
ncbi:MAG: hypothetical protein RBT34_12470 [Anaerolineaceae bacterium]|nr:hypothetical protein [Anaerolineaceae bacterium]